MEKIHNLQGLKKDVLDGIEEKCINKLQALVEKWKALRRAYDIDPQLLPKQISVKTIAIEVLPQIADELKKITQSAQAIASDPFLVFDWPETNLCSENDHLEEGEVDQDNGEPRCKELAIYAGCWEGWGYGMRTYCKKHMDDDYDWRWYALLPLTIDLLG